MSIDPRYPIGQFVPQTAYSGHERQANMAVLAAAHSKLRDAVAGLSEAQVNTAYRDGGWTVRQVTHHLPDSHANMYIRLKLALTESEPVITPYDEGAWALLADNDSVPLEVSIAMLEAVHSRLLGVLTALPERDWLRVYRHPENGAVSVERALALYAWHASHHVAQITQLRQRMGW